MKKGKLTLTSTEFLLLLMLYGCLVILAVSFVSGYSMVCADGKTFDKMWSGWPDSVIGNVTIKNLNTTQILWNAPIPVNHNIHLTMPHDTLLNITWTDWRGAQCETHKVECVGNNDCLTNYIPPPPKSA